MDADLIKLILQKAPSLGPAGVIIALWALKAIYNTFKTKDSERDSALVALNTTMHEVTLAVTKLTVQMEYLNRSMEKLPSMEKDISAIGEKVRRLDKGK